jgi:hypothetical protein
MTAVVAGIADAFETRLARRALEPEELRRLPAATVAELNESGLITSRIRPADGALSKASVSQA